MPLFYAGGLSDETPDRSWQQPHDLVDAPRLRLTVPAKDCEMIRFDNVTKIYHGRKFEKLVFADLSFTIEKGESIGICGANGAGKSTLMRLLSGVEHPTSGTVTRTMVTSWPIGYAGCFQSSLTGADNARFIARIYNRPERELLDFVEDFAQLGPYLQQPVKTYSSGMAARLAFGISLAIDFECYLVDEVTGAGDERFRARSQRELDDRAGRSTLIMISHDVVSLKAYCKRGAIVFGGSLILFDDVEEAFDTHTRLQARHH